MNDFKKFYNRVDQVLVYGNPKITNAFIQGIETKEGIINEFNIVIEIKANINGVCTLDINRTIRHRLTEKQMDSISSFPLVAVAKRVNQENISGHAE